MAAPKKKKYKKFNPTNKKLVCITKKTLKILELIRIK